MRDRQPPELVVATLQVVLATAWCSTLLVLLFLGLLPHTGLYRTMTVLSGSMRPTFSPGDLVVTMPEPASRVQVGDVVTFAIPVDDHHVESHRVVEILQRRPSLVVRTKGDASNAPDPWLADLGAKHVWHVSMTVPWVGWPIHWLRDPRLRLLLVLVAPALSALLMLRKIWTAPAESRRDASAWS